jgi:hypothetical protein
VNHDGPYKVEGSEEAGIIPVRIISASNSYRLICISWHLPLLTRVARFANNLCNTSERKEYCMLKMLADAGY